MLSAVGGPWQHDLAELFVVDLLIAIALDRGDAEAVIWTTDLSYDYVSINAKYRT